MKSLKSIGMSLFVAIGLTFAGVAFAKTYTSSSSKVTIEVPDNWNQRVDSKTGMLFFSDPKDEVGVMMWPVDTTDLKAVLKALDKELEKQVQDLKWQGDSKKVNINGMPTHIVDGTGKVKDKGVKIGVAVVDTPTKKELVVLAMAEAAKYDGNRATIKAIFDSLKPTK